MPKVAFLTSGGIAPCLSASIGGLIEKYNELDPNIEMVGYMHCNLYTSDAADEG